MKKCYSLAVLLLAVPLLLCAGNYQLKKSATKLGFQIINELILVKASINGQCGHFLFDTGAADLTLNSIHYKAYSKAAHGHHIADLNTVLSNPLQMHVDLFAMNGIQRKNFNVPVVDLSRLEHKMEIKILGLIGYKVLKQFEVIFDYHNRLIHILNLEEQFANQTPLLISEPNYTFNIKIEQFLPMLEAELNGQNLNLAFDSGAALNIIDRKFEKQLFPMAVQTRVIKLGGAFSNSNELQMATFLELNLEENLRIKWWRAAFNELQSLRKVRVFIDGILGVGFLHQGIVAINYPEKQIKIWSHENLFSNRFQAIEAPMP